MRNDGTRRVNPCTLRDCTCDGHITELDQVLETERRKGRGLEYSVIEMFRSFVDSRTRTCADDDHTCGAVCDPVLWAARAFLVGCGRGPHFEETLNLIMAEYGYEVVR